ncbi:hypothetical protein Ga0100231_018660 [Opitutaceae bacterium TAV4]|nr:hypothetical protein Ga0100231_018660 [Opitutaceae bacterium TAV4]RRK00128.1 hypothetical protein Ga0100230_019320 [Opitutaceae bacterium TAV3]
MTPRIAPYLRTLLLLAAACVLLFGCSTPDRRIEQNLALFNTLTVEQQDLIKQGKVGLGFTPDMVRLAVGNPNNKWLRTDETGTSESWSYTSYTAADGTPLYCGLYHSYYGNLYPYYAAPIYTGRAPSEYFRVTFKDGKVISIQQDVR